MTNAGQIVAAFRDIAATKSLTTDEVYDLIRDGIVAGLVKIYGPNVEAEIDIDEGSGDIEIIVLKRVVEEVEDPSSEIALGEARWDDPYLRGGGRNGDPRGVRRIRQKRRHGHEAADRPAGPGRGASANP